MVKMEEKRNTIKQRNQEMLTRANSMQAFFKRNILKMYQDAQRKRFSTENQSEGKHWPELEGNYKTYKRKRFAAYPGSGRKMMIATDALRRATIDDVYNIATNFKLFVSINPNTENPESKEPVSRYAGYAVAERPVMLFGKTTIAKWRKAIDNYMMKGAR